MGCDTQRYTLYVACFAAGGALATNIAAVGSGVGIVVTPATFTTSMGALAGLVLALENYHGCLEEQYKAWAKANSDAAKDEKYRQELEKLQQFKNQAEQEIERLKELVGAQ